MSRVVLVTGAAGFIGSHLVSRLLDDGFSVVGLDNFNDFYDPAIKMAAIARYRNHRSFRMIEGDIRDRSLVRGVFEKHRPVILIHLAAMAGVRPSIANPVLYADVNVNGTAVVLEAAAEHAIEMVLFSSSSSVYGNNRKVPFSEDDPVDEPISPYAATKRAGELLVHAFHSVYGIPSVCLRFFTVFGPGQRPDLAIARFMDAMRAGREFPVFGDGRSSRDYTYVEDIVDGIVAATQHSNGFSIFNIGGDRPVVLSDLVEAISRVTGIEPRIRNAPMQPGDVSQTWADLEKAKRCLGYSPKVDLEDGLRRQWESLFGA